MSDTLTPGYALNVLYSYAFDAPGTKRNPGLNDINTALSVLRDTIAQLAAERAARQAEREAMARLAESQHRYVDLVALRDQQIAALREGLESLVGNAGGYDMSIVRALCHQARAAGGNPSALNLVERVMAAEETARALLAPPAGEPDDEIRMPIHLGIPGIGVVVSAGPRPELVLEDDPPDGDAAP